MLYLRHNKPNEGWFHEKVFRRDSLLAAMVSLTALAAPVFAQGQWQMVKAITDPGSPAVNKTESGTASASEQGTFDVGDTESGTASASQQDASAPPNFGSTASASASGTGGTNNSYPTASGMYGITATYGWSGMGPSTSYFYLDITPSASASWQQADSPSPSGIQGSGTGNAYTNPATVSATVGANQRFGGAPSPANPGATHFKFNTGNNTSPTLDIIANAQASANIYAGTGTASANASATITVSITPSAN